MPGTTSRKTFSEQPVRERTGGRRAESPRGVSNIYCLCMRTSEPNLALDWVRGQKHLHTKQRRSGMKKKIKNNEQKVFLDGQRPTSAASCLFNDRRTAVRPVEETRRDESLQVRS